MSSEPIIKPLGVDHHARKLLTGKFASNVQPRNAGKDATPTHDWACKDCGWINRYYWVTCQDCNERNRPW